MTTSPSVTFYVFGAGCYGRLHIRHLLTARKKGRLQFDRLVVIDRNPRAPAVREWSDHPRVTFRFMDWVTFLVEAFADGRIHPMDELVLPCIGPHLMFHWLQRTIARLTGQEPRHIPWNGRVGIPFETTLDTGMHAVSYALWRCPPTCIEPAMCPGNGQKRNWEMFRFISAHARFWNVRGRSIDHVEIFTSTHRAWGVATLPVKRLLDARRRVITAVQHKRIRTLLVATVSSCHGLMGLMAIPSAGVNPDRSN